MSVNHTQIWSLKRLITGWKWKRKSGGPGESRLVRAQPALAGADYHLDEGGEGGEGGDKGDDAGGSFGKWSLPPG